MGPYLDPLGVGFANGTVVARGVEVDVERDVIGGVDELGNGWKFLMEALAAGRGVALPAGAAGSSGMLANAVGAYAALRRQFKLPLRRFEGVQELADMALKTYEIDSLVALMNCALDAGERPPVLSAILKQRTTELGRDVVNHAMDVCAGAAICMGEQNFVAPAYLSTPIGITVEGSNTMTRSLLVFGQGMVRSHPHLLALMRAVRDDDADGFARAIDRRARQCVAVRRARRRRAAASRASRFFAASANASLLLAARGRPQA